MKHTHNAFTDFYNDRVNHESFPWRDDHHRWKHPAPGTFSFCAYPFMVDPACKQRVLQLDNRKEQEGEFQGAIIKYLLSPSGQSNTPFLMLKVCGSGGHCTRGTEFCMIVLACTRNCLMI